MSSGRLQARRNPPLHAGRRTCVGCRARDERSELLRVVAIDGEIVPDERHRLPGRGAWLHPTAECLDEAVRRRAFGRALRLSTPVDLARLRAWLDQQHTPGGASHDAAHDNTTDRKRV